MLIHFFILVNLRFACLFNFKAVSHFNSGLFYAMFLN